MSKPDARVVAWRYYAPWPDNFKAALGDGEWRFITAGKEWRPDDAEPLVPLTLLAEAERERDSWKAQVYDEIAANLAFRESGNALPDEDMPTFCARLISERDALQSRLDAVVGLTGELVALAKAHEIKADRGDTHPDVSHWHGGYDEGVTECVDRIRAALGGESRGNGEVRK